MPFKNVEELTIEFKKDVQFKAFEIDAFAENGLFSVLRRLKTLRISEDVFYSNFKPISRFVQNHSNRRNLQVFYNGIQMVDGHEFDGWNRRIFSCPYDFWIAVLMKNFSKTEDELRCISALNYAKSFKKWFERQDNAWIPVELFIKKFNRLESIEVFSKIECPNRFVKFLAGCKCLNILKLWNSGLGQQFYDLLPSITSLSELFTYDDQNQGLNFRFVSRMFRLWCISSDKNLLIAIQNEDFQLNRFTEIEFQTNEKGNFWGSLFRYQTTPKSFRVRASMYNYQINRNGQYPQFNGTVQFSVNRVFENMDNQVFLDFYIFF